MIDYHRKAIELAGICRFTSRPSPGDWEVLPKELSGLIPENHKRLVNHFGSGHFGNDLYLLCPCGHANVRLDASTHNRFIEDYSPMLKEIHLETWRKIFPSQGGMVLVAETTSRIAVLVDGGGQVVALDLGSLMQLSFKVDFAEFICRLYEGDYRKAWDKDYRDWLAAFRSSLWSNPSRAFFTPERAFPFR